MPGPNGVLSFRGDLKHSYDCDAQAIRIASRVPVDLETEEIATLASQANPEDLELPTKKPTILVPPKEVDVMKIDLGTSDPSKTATISSHLPKEFKLALANFLWDNNDIFAWKLTDMPGVPRKLAEHIIDLNEGSKPVKQRLRRFSPNKKADIKKEIMKPLVAGFILEILHPDWLANPVLVQKDSNKWRMCVEYMNLNKYCPKDPFGLLCIDHIVDSTAGSTLLYFLNCYSGYH
jgi:hypothetical protein